MKIDTYPIIFDGLRNYKNPLNKVRKYVVDKVLKSFFPRNSVTKKWINWTNFILLINNYYNYYNYNHVWSKVDYSEVGIYNNGIWVCDGYSKIFKSMCICLGQESYYISAYTKDSIVKGKVPPRTVYAWNSIKIDDTFF